MEIALLILRIGTGLLFAAHGAHKFLGKDGIRGTGSVFESIGLRPGRHFASAAAVNEVLGGLLLAAGLLTPLAAALIIATMTTAFGLDIAGFGWALGALAAGSLGGIGAVGLGRITQARGRRSLRFGS
jgi:putative oxidoreductase